MAKTRYLQISLTTMLEYNLESAEDNKDIESKTFKYLFTRLLDGHYAILSPVSYEVEESNEKPGTYKKLTRDSFVTMNTFNHTAVPMDAKDSEWFIFNDNDYKYVNESNLNDFNDVEDNKTKVYHKYLLPVDGEKKVKFGEIADTSDIKWDNMKLYFSSGYDFSDIYGTLIRMYVERKDGTYLDLCNLFYTRSSVYKFINYMTTPIIFGNVIYDKYLNVKLLSPNSIFGNEELCNLLNVKVNAPIKLMCSYVENDNVSVENIVFKNNTFILNGYDVVLDNAASYFARASTIKGTIPTETLNSDNIGVYLASTPEFPYIEFYGTWKDKPLDSLIVHNFNKSIMLYDQSLVKRGSVTYEIDDDYHVEYDMKKWLAHHEIQCDLIKNIDDDVKVIKSETYTQSQAFLGMNNETLKFYYRPIIFDDYTTLEIGNGEVAMVISYTLRLMNIEDGVQFIKSGALSLSGNELFKFCGKTTNLNFSDRLPYKVYNKIVNQKQEIKGHAGNSGMTTKYVKVYYNMTDIVLDVNGNNISSGKYELQLSQAPRNYKFVFKQKDFNGNTNYMDLTDTYYKLYIHDAAGTEVIIEPTYSNNMNLLLGELEFNISSSNLNILRSLPEDRRYMSIIAYNADNSTSSMYDMTYTF